MSNRPQLKRLKEQDDDSSETETYFILRVPPEVVPTINDFIENGDQYNEDIPGNIEEGACKMSMRFDDDVRTGELIVAGKHLSFTVKDLPTINEIYKVANKDTVYKISDCSQILDCTTAPVKAVVAESESKAKFGDSRDSEAFKYPHGLNPPLKNVCKRRFRKTKKKKYIDAPQMEVELKRLLRADLKATSVRWEILDSDEEEVNEKAETDEEETVVEEDKASSLFFDSVC